jgi:peroxiredoxin
MTATLRAGGRPGAPGPPAPDFELESHAGERVRLSSYRGEKSVVLFFMRAYT